MLVNQLMHSLCHALRAYTYSSGSAFPATLAFQIRELERETNHDLKLDAIVTVIDAENFSGYEDTSPTAKMQASYTDVILIVSLLAAAPLKPRSQLSAEQVGVHLRPETRHPH